ncbi:MAG: ADP-glyceromanno-heptose 6-epimerase [Bacteroidetes bacterium]|nr:MAG: ADP-glyceromanno-heptose 6-epimerase [Bacteroidota bacterium]PTM12875.1 MAG: ADP-glyceromanno-heptose 6-epimerase [Bacteroidota bacterium]
MKVLLTGGAGYIGYGLVRQLMFAPEISEIIIYDNLSRRNYAFFDHQKFIEKPLRFVHGDILDGRTLQQTLQGVDVIFHLAAKVTTPFADTDAHSFDQINHWGTAQVAYAAEQTDVQHLIYVSSAAVYGDTDTAVNEDAIPDPHSYYGIAKLAGEEQVLRLQNKMKVQVIRSGNVYGYNPAYRIDAVMNRFIFEAHFQGRVSVQGSGEQQRSFLHVDKLATALRQLLNSPLPSGTYNLAEHNFSINDILLSLKILYPDLETILINPNMPRRNISLQVPARLWSQLFIPDISLLDEFQAFQAVFAFRSK